MAQATMNVRIDEDVKKSFDEFCADAGLNASVAVNMFVRAVLRSRRIPFDITDITTETSDEKYIANALIETLLDRIEEGEKTRQWVAHDSVIAEARDIIAKAKASNQNKSSK